MPVGAGDAAGGVEEAAGSEEDIGVAFDFTTRRGSGGRVVRWTVDAVVFFGVDGAFDVGGSENGDGEAGGEDDVGGRELVHLRRGHERPRWNAGIEERASIVDGGGGVLPGVVRVWRDPRRRRRRALKGQRDF